MVIGLAAIMMMLQSGPAVQTLPPRRDRDYPATRWSCVFARADGSTLTLSSLFPSAPAGSEANDFFEAVVSGEAPELVLGEIRLKSFESSDLERYYWAMLPVAEGAGHMNLELRVTPGRSELARLVRFIPREPMQVYATGACDSDFWPETGEQMQ